MKSGLIDTTVLRLPPGLSTRNLDARLRDKSANGFDLEFAATVRPEPAFDLDGVRIERIEASEADRRKLGAEEETLGVIDTMFFARMPSAAAPASGGDAARGGASTAWGREAIGLSDAPAFTGEGAVVAVLDTGGDADYEIHPAFWGMNIQAQDFTSSDPYAWGDHDGHGTHCEGPIFGQPVERTQIGVTLGIKTALISKVIGASAYRGILLAAHNLADVSMSLAINLNVLRQRHISVFGRSEAEATSLLTLKSYREDFNMFDTFSVLFAKGSTNVTLAWRQIPNTKALSRDSRQACLSHYKASILSFHFIEHFGDDNE